MGKYSDALDSIDPLGRQNRIKRELEKRIREQAAAKRLASSTVEEGGSLTVEGVLEIIGSLDLTGDLSMKSGDGAEMVRIGSTTYGRGLSFKRSNGITAFVLEKVFEASTEESWNWYDRYGNPIFSESGLSSGMSRPWLQNVMQPYAATSGTAVACGPNGFERTSSSTTWETVFFYEGKVQNPFVDLSVAAFCSDATTAGELQVVNLDTGNPLPGYLAAAWVGAIPAGTVAATRIATGTSAVFAMNGNPTPGSYIRVGLQVRRTAGTGSITIAVPRSTG